MYSVGNLERIISDGKPDVFFGHILDVPGLGDVECYIVPAGPKRQPTSPDFIVKARLPHEDDYKPRGSAWVNTGRDKKTKYLRISIQAPGMPKLPNGRIDPYKVSAFPADEQPKDAQKGREMVYQVSFNPNATNDAPPPAQSGSTGAKIGDAIPW